jgi:predicted DNA-binding antitoxin AbrB/MazE fold protein
VAWTICLSAAILARVKGGTDIMDKEEVPMVKTIDAIYENGILRPLEKLGLKQSQRLILTLEVLPSVVEETQALIRARADVVKEVAEHDEYF